MAKVIVAMSGGVDSAVTAALLIEQGFSVQGLTLQLWHASRTEQKGIERARQVAAQLGIPLHVQDVRESFQRTMRLCADQTGRPGRQPGEEGSGLNFTNVTSCKARGA